MLEIEIADIGNKLHDIIQNEIRLTALNIAGIEEEHQKRNALYCAFYAELEIYIDQRIRRALCSLPEVNNL